MSQIIQVELWKDVGFQEGAVEVPSKDDFLPDADIVFDDGIKTSTGDFFSKFTIPAVFSDYLSMSYLRVTYEYNNADELMVFYGWIDDVALKSDTDGSPSVSVSWHIDYWRTYIANAKFGYGLVQSRPRGVSDPPQSFTPRFRLPAKDEVGNTILRSVAYNGAGSDLQWILLTFTAESSSHKVTECRTMVAVVSKNAPVQSYNLALSGTTTSVKCPSLSEFINGDYDEKYGISASAVSSVFVSPIPPFEVDSVDGDTVYLKTSPTQQTESTITQTGSMPSYRVTSCNFNRVRITSFYYKATWTDSEHSDEQNETFRGDYRSDIKEWIDAHPGARDNIGVLHTTVNGSNVGFIMWKTIDGYARECTSGLNPVVGATFTINAGYVGMGMSRNVEVSDVNTNSITESVTGGTYTGGITATWNGTSWVSDRGTYVCFTSVNDGNWSYTTSQSSTAYSVSLESSSLTSGYGYAYTSTGHYPEHSQTLAEPIETNDTEEWIFTDMNGSPIGSAPWGIKLYSFTSRVIVSATSAYIEFRFNGKDSHAVGTSYIVPLPPVDLTSNSWSEYVYSGQRDYDIAQRKIAAEQALVSGITSSITGGASNAIMASIGRERASLPSSREWSNIGAALANTAQINSGIITGDSAKSIYLSYAREGAFQGAKGMNPLGAGTASIGIGVATSLVEYGLTQHYNDQLQKAEDQLQAKQIDSIVMAGTGWDWMWNGRDCGFIKLVGDEYSVQRFEADKKLNGIYCSEPTEDCTNLLSQDGPFMIAGLIVCGDIPSVARAYIKGRFEGGVRIVTKHSVPEEPSYDYLLVPRHYDGYAIWFKNEKGYTIKFDPDHLVTGATLAKGPMDSVIITGTPEPGTYNIPVVYTDGTEGTVKILVN